MAAREKARLGLKQIGLLAEVGGILINLDRLVPPRRILISALPYFSVTPPA